MSRDKQIKTIMALDRIRCLHQLVVGAYQDLALIQGITDQKQMQDMNMAIENMEFAIAAVEIKLNQQIELLNGSMSHGA